MYLHPCTDGITGVDNKWSMPIDSVSMKKKSLPIRRAVDHFGGVPQMVDAVGVSRASVYFWLAGRSISPEIAVRIEAASGGAVTRADLRPDLFGVAA